MDENCLELDFDEAILPKPCTKALGSAKNGDKSIDGAKLRSATSLDAWLGGVPLYPHRIPTDRFQLAFTIGDVDFADALRAMLIAAPAQTLAIVSSFCAKKTIPVLADLYRAGAFEFLDLVLSIGTFVPRSDGHATVAHITSGLIGASVPFHLRIATHHVKLAIAKGSTPWAFITSANINANRRNENFTIFTNPNTINAISVLVSRTFDQKVKYQTSNHPRV